MNNIILIGANGMSKVSQSNHLNHQHNGRPAGRPWLWPWG